MRRNVNRILFFTSLKQRAIIVFLFAALGNVAFGQFPRYVNIFNYSTDARQVALGGDAEGAAEGPSFLFPLRQPMPNNIIYSSFGMRPPGWNTNDVIPFHSVHLQKDIDSIVTVGALIARNVSGILNPITKTARTFHGNVELYQLFINGFVNFPMEDDLLLGLSAKIYSGNNSPFILFGISNVTPGRIQGSAYLLDVALQKTMVIEKSEGSNTTLLLQGALTNIGSDVRYNDSLSYKVPRSLHLAAIRLSTFGDYSFLAKIHTKIVLNAAGLEDQYFVGGGAEIGFREVLFGRLGIVMRPYSSIFGGKNIPQPVLGAGYRIRPKHDKLKGFSLMVDGALIPLTDSYEGSLLKFSRNVNYVVTSTITFPFGWTNPE